MRVTVSAEVSPHVLAGILALDDVIVVEREPRMDAAIADGEAAIRAGARRGEQVSAVRGMYRRFGVDPTKTRPSSEALLRRLRKGEPLPRINSAVDVCNWCSAESELPFGLYDRGRVQGDVTLRVGRPGEQYAGIRKDTVHVAGRLALADDLGPFGNPTSDSARTMVSPGTAHLLFVIFCPRSLGAAVAERALALTAARTLEFCKGAVALSVVV